MVVGVIASLQRHCLAVTKLLGAQEEVAAAQVQTSIRTLEAKMAKLKKRDIQLDHLAQTHSDVHFLQVM